MNCIYEKDGDKCQNETRGDYLACLIHGHTLHFTDRECACDECNPEREAAPIVNLSLFAHGIRLALAEAAQLKEAA
ncbi:MAG: hypothetical protein ACRD82_15540 [Blastocatellia bacterium]